MSNYQDSSVYNSPNTIGKITLLLIAINVGLFAIQVLSGVNITDPTTLDALRWGADYAPLTFLEEPYRLFSSMFFHFGILHLLMNMWALYI
ncbi:rhomboid family intramembrane serine protease, partial [Nakamurella silvestris]